MKRRIFYLLALTTLIVACNPVYAQRAAFPDDTVASSGSPAPQADYANWFARYDRIRQTAQMNPSERQRADNLMSKGLSIVVPGPEKVTTGQLLNKLVNKNRVAADQMKMLPLLPQTEQLHRGYYKYFNDATNLFGDYLKVQTNLFATDATGTSIARNLMPRKMELEQLDQNNKALDAQLRQQLGIPAYRNPY